MCGIQMDANPANMCVNCLRTQVDITEGIPKQLILHSCRGCGRYLRPPWVAAALESKELLAICLKKINGLSKVKLVDAGFIWTEPHSRHIKVKLTIQKDVLNGVKLQQVFAVDFAVQNQQCDACQRSYTDHHWRAQVQVRQKVEHKKTFYLLEQLILKHGAHEKCSGVEQVPSGVDFNFLERSHAMKFIDFLSSVVPTRAKSAKQLVSEDIHSAYKNYKFTYAVEIVPLCRDDLCVVPSKIAAAIGSMNPLALVFGVASVVYFVDPRTLQIAEMNSERYWRDPFRPICSANQLVEFTVLDVTPVTIAPLTGSALRRKQGKRAIKQLADASGARSVSGESGKKRGADGSVRGGDKGSVIGGSSVDGRSTFAGGFTGAVSLAGGSVQFNGAMSVASTVTGGPKGKLLLADAEVVRSSDLGMSDERYIVRTHMGNILRPGDTVLGYDLTQAVFNDLDADSHAVGGKGARKGTGGRGGHVDFPDIILVRKIHKREEKEAAFKLQRDIAAAKAAEAAAAAAAESTAMATDGDAAEGSSSGKPSKPRLWKLKRFEDALGSHRVKHSDAPGGGAGGNSRAGRAGAEAEKREEEYESFLRELECDPALRKSVNLYKNKEAIAAAAAARAAAQAEKGMKLAAKLKGAEEEDDEEEDGGEGEDGGSIGLEELLDEMELAPGDGETVPSEEGEEGGEGDEGEEEDGEEWGGTPAAVEPGFEGASGRPSKGKRRTGGAGGAGREGEAVYEDGGLGLTQQGRKELKDVAEEAGEEDASL